MTTTAHASTSLVLPNVIAKLMLMSKCHTSFDGVKTFQGEFIIKPLDAHLVYLACATSPKGAESHSKANACFIDEGDGYDWTVVQSFEITNGGFKVRFTLNDYTQQISNAWKVFKGFEFILTFNSQENKKPIVRYCTTPEDAIRLAQMETVQHPLTTWFVTRRSDGVCLAQSK